MMMHVCDGETMRRWVMLKMPMSLDGMDGTMKSDDGCYVDGGNSLGHGGYDGDMIGASCELGVEGEVQGIHGYCNLNDVHEMVLEEGAILEVSLESVVVMSRMHLQSQGLAQ
jgi:hypothetical protein